MKQNTILIIGGAIVVYLLWKKSQETTTTETTSEFSNVSGGKRPCFCTNPNTGALEYVGMATPAGCRRHCHHSVKKELFRD